MFKLNSNESDTNIKQPQLGAVKTTQNYSNIVFLWSETLQAQDKWKLKFTAGTKISDGNKRHNISKSQR